MTDEVGILAEGTATSLKTASRVLKIFRQNLNESFRFIIFKHRHLCVFKIKFVTKTSGCAGLLFFVFNSEKNTILRSALSISLNPYFFDTDLSLGWEEIEKRIYAERLEEGIIHEKTVVTSQRFRSFFQQAGGDIIFKNLFSLNNEKVEKTVQMLLKRIVEEDIFFQLQRERISMAEFRGFSPGEEKMSARKADADINLEVEIVEGKSTFFSFKRPPRAEKIIPGEVIFVKISDKREIAQVLSKFICAVDESVPVEVLEVRKENGFVDFKVRLGGSIRGIGRADARMPVAIYGVRS